MSLHLGALNVPTGDASLTANVASAYTFDASLAPQRLYVTSTGPTVYVKLNAATVAANNPDIVVQSGQTLASHENVKVASFALLCTESATIGTDVIIRGVNHP